MRILSIVIACFLFASLAIGAETIEVIPLKHKSAAEQIPIIEPLLQSGEALSGQQKQIVIRASHDRINKLRSVIEQFDSPSQLLRVTVRRAPPQEINKQNATSARTYGTRKPAESNDQFSVTTIDSDAAYVQTGVSVPLAGNGISSVKSHVVSPINLIPAGITYKDTISGIFILPELEGEVVTLYVTSQQEAFVTTGSHQVNRNAIMTTVRGQLGTWISLGGTSDSKDTGQGRIYSTSARDEDKTSWWIKAERL
jgi:hypothetical protein